MRYANGTVSAGRATTVAATLLLWNGVAMAQTAPGTPASSAPSVTPMPDYHPSLGDLMTMAIQPRHTKLGLAGQAGNWPYAQYELSELRNAFARIGRTIPTYRNIDMAAVIGVLTNEPLKAVEQAINARDAGQFKTAYAGLTITCNACHQSQDHPMVVVRVPGGNTYPDQDFRRPSGAAAVK